MPIYEYICPDDGAVTECRNRVAERDMTPPCDVCGGETRRRPSVLSRVWSPTRKGDK